MINLLRTSRFAPLFWTQLLGAFNDNLLKSAIVAALTFGTLQRADMPLDVLVNVVTGLLVLPFFFFSAVAGQIADRMDKSTLARVLKVVELGAMGLAAAGFVTGSVHVLLLALFAMGTQSAFFGPVKYAILPQHLEEEELVAGNALVEMGTFVAILVGTLAGTLALALGSAGLYVVAGAIVLVAGAGVVSARFVPSAPAAESASSVRIRPIAAFAEAAQAGARDRRVAGAILGVSAFWGLGAVVLGQLPRLAMDLGAGEHGLTGLLAAFSVGIGIGSFFSERVARGGLELGVAPFGALGIAIVALLLPTCTTLLSACLAIGTMGVFGGLFVVPLYARMQQHAREDERSRVIAANNIANAIFMVAGAGYAAWRLGSGAPLNALFVDLGLAQLLVAAIAIQWLARDFLHVLMRRLVNALYRLDVKNLDRIPKHGAALLVANHVSFVDAFIVGALIGRPMRFVMDHQMAKLPGLAWFFRLGGAIPIASRKQNPALLETALATVDSALANGELVMIFPEGKCTRDGEVDTFRRGVEAILTKQPVPVHPVGLRGLWGSVFSYRGGYPMTHRPRRFRARVQVSVGEALAPTTSADELRAAVLALVGKSESTLCEADLCKEAA